MAFVSNENAWRSDQATDIEREHLLDQICTISPMRTPWLSTLPKFRVTATDVKYVTDQLASGGTPANGDSDVQAIAENTDADFDAVEGPYQIFNRIHGFRETKSVSDRLNYMNTIAVEDVFAALMVKGIKEQAKKIEFALYHSLGQNGSGSGNSQSPSALADKMFGFRQQTFYAAAIAAESGWQDLPSDLRGTTRHEAASPSGYLDEYKIDDLMQDMYAKGAVPSDIWAPVVQKRYIAKTSANSTRNIEAEDRALIHTIDVYEGVTGMVVVNLHPVVKTDEIFMTETALMEIGVLKPTTAEQLARMGDSYKGMVETVLTNIVRCPAAMAIMYDLDTNAPSA